jgi:hypothetical protein
MTGVEVPCGWFADIRALVGTGFEFTVIFFDSLGTRIRCFAAPRLKRPS